MFCYMNFITKQTKHLDIYDVLRKQFYEAFNNAADTMIYEASTKQYWHLVNIQSFS